MTITTDTTGRHTVYVILVVTSVNTAETVCKEKKKMFSLSE